MFANVKSDEEVASLIVKYQIKREFEAEAEAKKSNSRIVIICDRSAIEPAAYIGLNGISSILEKYNKDFETTRDSYDLVIHFTTAAKGAQEYYTLENNDARTEGVEDAIKLDDKLLEIWKEHKNRTVIYNNSKGFDNKLQKATLVVLNHISKIEKQVL